MLTILRKLLNKNPLREISETDRKVLAICMTAAFVFWLILNLSRTYTIRKTVSFNYLLDPERTLAQDSPVLSSQEIAIEGPGWDLIWESLSFDDLAVELDLRGRKNLEITRPDLQRRIIRQLSSGDLSVNNLDFVRKTIITAPKEGKTVPVTSRVKTSFADGFLATGQPVFVPDSIVVTGPGDLLAELTEWPTEAVSVTEVEEDVRQTVALAPPANSLTPSRSTVEYTLDVEAFIQRTLDVPVTVINAPEVDSFQIIPAVVRLRVTLPQTSYYLIGPDDFSIVADLGDTRNENGKNSVPLTMRLQPAATISATMETRAVEFYIIK